MVRMHRLRQLGPLGPETQDSSPAGQRLSGSLPLSMATGPTPQHTELRAGGQCSPGGRSKCRDSGSDVERVCLVLGRGGWGLSTGCPGATRGQHNTQTARRVACLCHHVWR